MSYHIRLSAILLLLLFHAGPALAQNAAAKPAAGATGAGNIQVTKPIYAWKTETSEKEGADKSKVFSHCLTKNMYDNGILLLIAENEKHQRRLALHFPQDKLTVSAKYDLQWQVDRQADQPVTAIAATPRILALAIDDAMTQQMMRGNMLFLRGPNDTLVFDMSGVGEAVYSMQNCLITHHVQDAVTGAPIASAAATAPAAVAKTGSNALSLPVASSGSARKAEPAPAAVAVPAAPAPKAASSYDAFPSATADLFTRAGLKPYKVMIVPENERDNKPFDAVWTQGNLFIGVKTDRPVPHQALMQIAATFTGKLQQLCGGEFLAEAGDMETRGSRYVMPVEIACSPADTTQAKNTIAALLFSLDTKSLQIYFIEAPEKQGNQAIQARDRLSKQIK